jgi:hypothetical protein
MSSGSPSPSVSVVGRAPPFAKVAHAGVCAAVFPSCARYQRVEVVPGSISLSAGSFWIVVRMPCRASSFADSVGVILSGDSNNSDQPLMSCLETFLICSCAM